MADNLSPEQVQALLNGMGDGDDTDGKDSPEVAAESDSAEALDGGEVSDGGEEIGDGVSTGDVGGEEQTLLPMELDILGEVYNISMGAAATAVSSLLRMKVDITTPQLTLLKESELEFKTLEPAVGVEINYIIGVQGVNIFILSQLDVMKIVDIWMGGAGQIDESAEFGEMHMSAIGELMNQMMGQSSMAMANFLNTVIDISTPTAYVIEGDYSLAKREPGTEIVATKFKLTVGDNVIDSELIATCDVGFAKDMIAMAKVAFGMSDGSNVNVQSLVEDAKQEDTAEAAPQEAAPVSPQPAAEPQAAAAQQPVFTPEPQMQPRQQPVYQQAQPAAQPQQQQPYQVQQPQYQAQPVSFGSFDLPDDLPDGYMGNLNLIRRVPLNITAEIGRTRLPMREILEDFGEGYVVELDRQAADPIDIFVNGVLIAKGSVVVVEENFGVKITEIIAPEELIRVAGIN